MKIYAIVPVKKLRNSKKRLSHILDKKERIELSRCMLIDVLNTLSNSSVEEVIVVTRDKDVIEIAEQRNVSIIYEKSERGVNHAVSLADERCKECDASMVVPQDLPFILPEDIDIICNTAVEKKCMVLTPSSRYDGTNILLRKPGDIMETHYDEDSYKIHLRIAKARKIPVKMVLNNRLMFDIDESDDIKRALDRKQDTRTAEYLDGLRHQLDLG